MAKEYTLMKKLIVAMLIAVVALTSVFAVGEISMDQTKNYYLTLNIDSNLYVGFQKGGEGAVPTAELASIFKDWTTPFVDGFAEATATEAAHADTLNFTKLAANGEEFDGQFGIFFLVKPEANVDIKMSAQPLKSGANQINWQSTITGNTQTYTYGSGEGAGNTLASSLNSGANNVVIYEAGAGVAHRGAAVFNVTTTGGAAQAPKGNYEAQVTITVTAH